MDHSKGKQTQEYQENIDEDEDVEESFVNPEDAVEIDVDDGDQPMDDEDENDGEAMPGLSANDVEIDDSSVQHFQQHRGSVFAVSVHPTELLAASGGEDDLGFLWDITDGEVIAKLTGHSDSVTSTAFSYDGEMIATGGMDGKVRIWRRVGKENWKTWEFLTELQGPDEVMWLRWHPKGLVLLAGSNDSTVWLWQLPSGKTMQVFAGHTGPVQCGEFTPDGKKIVTADGEGNLILWEARSPNPIFKLSSHGARFDLDGITSLAVNPLSTLAVVGGAAGGVRVVGLNKGEVVAALGGHTEGESIEAVQFIDLTGTGSGPGVVATGATDGKICVWDLSTMRLRVSVQHGDAVTTLLSHQITQQQQQQSHLLVSASADKTLRTWDARTGALVREHKGHQGPVLGAALGMKGQVIVSAGDDGVCLVFTTTE